MTNGLIRYQFQIPFLDLKILESIGFPASNFISTSPAPLFGLID